MKQALSALFLSQDVKNSEHITLRFSADHISPGFKLSRLQYLRSHVATEPSQVVASWPFGEDLTPSNSSVKFLIVGFIETI